MSVIPQSVLHKLYRGYCLAKYSYDRGAYISVDAQQRHIDNDTRGYYERCANAAECKEWCGGNCGHVGPLAQLVEAAYAAGREAEFVDRLRADIARAFDVPLEWLAPLPEVPSPFETARVDRAVLDKAQAGLDPDVARVATEVMDQVVGIPLRPAPGSVDLVLVHDWAKDLATLRVTYRPGAADE